MSEIVQNQYSSWQAENSAKFIYNGFIYVGKVDTDPLIEANRVRVYYIDENEQEVDLTQPIKTNSSGFPVVSETNSTVIQVRTDSDYSVKVLSRNGTQEWYIPKASSLSPVISINHNDTLNRNAPNAHQASAISLDNGGNVETAITYVTPEMMGGIQQAIDFCQANQSVTLMLFGEYNQGTTPLKITSPFTIFANAIITFDYEFNDTGLSFGEPGSNLTTTANARKMVVNGSLSIIRARNTSNQPRWWVDLANDQSRGIEIWNNSECEYGVITVDGFKSNFSMSSDTTAGCVRNSIRGLYSTNGLSNFNVRITDSAVGFVNENDIFGGTFGNSTQTPDDVRSSMVSCNLNAGEVTFKPNGNNFWSVTMENTVSDLIIDINGQQNSFRECRAEFIQNGSIRLRSGSFDNVFDSNFGAAFGQGGFNDESGGRNVFEGFGAQYHNSFSATSGVYTGKNFTTSPDGGKAGYPIFTAFYESNPNAIAASLSQTGLYSFNDTNNGFPTFFADGESKRVWFGSGFFDIKDGQSVRASTDKKTLLWESAESPNGFATNHRSGSWETPDILQGTGNTTADRFYEWYDSSGNKRAKKGSVPSSETDGTIISANPVT
ncbi:MAG: hypothetical protein GY928_28410 [Colwellia sp.]|nr:hypothetical protein [Colwellia sp.]